MRIPKRLCTVGTLVLVAIPLAQADEGRNLWSRAVEICDDARHALSTRIRIRNEVRDESTGHACRTVTELTLNEISRDMSIDWHRVETQEVTPADPDRADLCEFGADVKGEIVVPVMGFGPLLSSEADRVRVRDVAGERVIEGRRCLVHPFRWRRKLGSRRIFEGEACLDAETAAPLEVRYRPKRRLRGSESVVTTLRYDDVEPLGWVIVGFDLVLTERGKGGAGRSFTFRAELRDHHHLSELLARPEEPAPR